jgi:hypothetical protein
MSSTIRIKRRDATGSAGAPSSLLNAELAFNESDKVLYYGFGAGANAVANSIIAIGGEGAFVSKNVTQTANVVLAGPASGSDAAPTFRALVANDIPTLTASKISDFDTQVRLNRLDQLAAPTSSVSLNSQKITSLADPTAAQDAATKAYVDAASSGLDVKASVRAATTANITLSGLQTVDGVVLAAGNRVLVKDQTNATQNGIYVVVNAAPWTRATDADNTPAGEVTPGMFTFVEEGTANANAGFVLTTTGTITLGTTNLTFAQFSGAGQITAGSGLSKTGNTINVGGTTNRISVGTDSIDISSSYVGQSSITTLGTVTTGTWSATAISATRGGTGLTTIAKGSVLVANTLDTISALDGGGSLDGILTYDSGTDVISWSNVIDGGTF